MAEYRAVGGRALLSVASQRCHVTATLHHVAGRKRVALAELVFDVCTRNALVAALAAYRCAFDARFISNPIASCEWKSNESMRRRASSSETFFGVVREHRPHRARLDGDDRDPTGQVAAPKSLTEAEAHAALGAGPRLAALASMTAPDVTGVPPAPITVLDKGHKEQILALCPLASSALETYLASRAERLRHLAIDESVL